MTNSDDYRLYIEARITGLGSLINAQFENVHDTLKSIDEQTKRTNSRVNHLEDDIEKLERADLTHIADCPAMPKIQSIQDDLVEYKWFKKHPKAGLFIIGVASALIFFNTFDILDKKFVAKDLIEQTKQISTEYKNLILTIDSLKKK